MTKFLAILGTESKRFLYSKKSIVFVLFLIITAYIGHMDCLYFKNTIEEKKIFEEIESQSFKMLSRYTLYQVMGFRVLYRPGPLEILFSCSGSFSECTAQITGLTYLNVYQDLKGPSIFPRSYSVPLDVSGLLLLLGTLYSIMFWGYPSLRHKEYLRMLAGKRPPGFIHAAVILSRSLLLALKLLLLFGTLAIVFVFHHIDLTASLINGLYGYFAVTLIVMFFFFLLGALAGQLVQGTWQSITLVIIAWLSLAFFISGPVNYLLRAKAQQISFPYQTEFKKLEIATNFEKRLEEKYGKFDRGNIGVERQIIEDFWQIDYKQIREEEENHVKEIESAVNTYEKIHILTPITFYTATANGLSTSGGRNFLDFYRYVLDMQTKFVRFIIDRTYYNDPKVLVSFINAGENIFTGKSRLPGNFSTGCIVNLAYILSLYFISYFTFKKSLFSMKPGDLKALGKIDITMEKGKFYAWLVKSDYFKKVLLNLFSGNFKEIRRKGFDGKVIINGFDVASEKMVEGFLYFCPPADLPGDIKVKDFINLFSRLQKIPTRERKTVLANPGIAQIIRKPFNILSESEKFNVLLAILQLKSVDILLIDNIASGLEITCSIRLKELLEKKEKEGTLAIYLATTPVVAGKEMKEHVNEGSYWIYTIEGSKRQLQMNEQDESTSTTAGPAYEMKKE